MLLHIQKSVISEQQGSTCSCINVDYFHGLTASLNSVHVSLCIFQWNCTYPKMPDSKGIAVSLMQFIVHLVGCALSYDT